MRTKPRRRYHERQVELARAKLLALRAERLTREAKNAADTALAFAAEIGL